MSPQEILSAQDKFQNEGGIDNALNFMDAVRFAKAGEFSPDVFNEAVHMQQAYNVEIMLMIEIKKRRAAQIIGEAHLQYEIQNEG